MKIDMFINSKLFYISKMAKKIPLTRRLEIALGETSSNSEKDIVFGRLYKTATKVGSAKSCDEFYGTVVTQNALDPIYNRKEVSNDEVRKGKELSNFLNNSIIIPQAGATKDYRKKMKQAMEVEYNSLMRYFENE